ncbi:hypothetical protein ACOMHN_009009 [Nucella lapillus]
MPLTALGHHKKMMQPNSGGGGQPNSGGGGGVKPSSVHDKQEIVLERRVMGLHVLRKLRSEWRRVMGLHVLRKLRSEWLFSCWLFG